MVSVSAPTLMPPDSRTSPPVCTVPPVVLPRPFELVTLSTPPETVVTPV